MLGAAQDTNLARENTHTHKPQSAGAVALDGRKERRKKLSFSHNALVFLARSFFPWCRFLFSVFAHPTAEPVSTRFVFVPSCLSYLSLSLSILLSRSLSLALASSCTTLRVRLWGIPAIWLDLLKKCTTWFNGTDRHRRT